MTLRWVSWAAVSSQPQAAPDKISIPEQLRLNQEHAARHGGEIVAELIVPGESRSIDTWEEACDRIDAYAQLRTLLLEKAFDVLVYYDASRLARTLSLGATIRQLCTRRGIILYQTTAPPAELRAGWRHDQALVDAIQSVGAQEEVAKLVERRRLGMIGRVQRGEFPNRPNFGYLYQYSPNGVREVVVVDEAAATVREVFRLYLAGHGFSTIALELQRAGRSSPSGAEWTHGMVRELVDHVWVYAGQACFNYRSARGTPVVRAPGRWEPLISEETARLVETERAQREVNRRLPEARVRLAGVCYCAVCGGVMHYRRMYPAMYNPHLEDVKVYLRCVRHRPSLSLSESIILATLETEIQALRNADLDTLTAHDIDILAPLRARLTDSEEGRERTEAALRRADDAYVQGLMGEDRYRSQVERLRAQSDATAREWERLTIEIAKAEREGTRRRRLVDVRNDGLEMLRTSDIVASNIWLRRHIKVVCTARRVASIIWL